jgi:hypothetical protein
MASCHAFCSHPPFSKSSLQITVYSLKQPCTIKCAFFPHRPQFFISPSFPFFLKFTTANINHNPSQIQLKSAIFFPNQLTCKQFHLINNSQLLFLPCSTRATQPSSLHDSTNRHTQHRRVLRPLLGVSLSPPPITTSIPQAQFRF